MVIRMSYSNAFLLLFLGSSSSPNGTYISTESTLQWFFSTDNIIPTYNVEIRNKSGAIVYSAMLNETQLKYAIPNQCNQYNAIVNATYRYLNISCSQSLPVPLFGGKDKKLGMM